MHYRHQYWIGLQTSDPKCSACNSNLYSECQNCRDKWYWMDNSTMDYKNWNSNEPTGNGEGDGCARLAASGVWADVATCGDKYIYTLCKRGVLRLLQGVFFFTSI